MNEVWRTLKPNGYFLSHTPVYPYSAIFGDPTHVSVVTHETFTAYFDDVSRNAEMYGFKGSFKVVSQHLIITTYGERFTKEGLTALKHCPVDF